MSDQLHKLRNLEINRVDLVDKGANQRADIVIAKKHEGFDDTQLKNGPPFASKVAGKMRDDEEKKKKKKGAKGSAFPEKMAADSSTSAGEIAKHFPGRHDQDRHGDRGGSSGSSLMEAYGRSEGGTRGRFDGVAAIERGKGEFNSMDADLLMEVLDHRSDGGAGTGPSISSDLDSFLTSRNMSDVKAPRRSISEIAGEIRRDWGPDVNYGAKPYLSAMRSLDKMTDSYYNDDARSVVAYFLSNSRTWKGDTARRVKAELKEMLKNPIEKVLLAKMDEKNGKPHDDDDSGGMPTLNDVKDKLAKPSAKPDAAPQTSDTQAGDGLGLDEESDSGESVPNNGPAPLQGKRPTVAPEAPTPDAGKKKGTPLDPKRQGLADKMKKDVPPSGNPFKE